MQCNTRPAKPTFRPSPIPSQCRGLRTQIKRMLGLDIAELDRFEQAMDVRDFIPVEQVHIVARIALEAMHAEIARVLPVLDHSGDAVSHLEVWGEMANMPRNIEAAVGTRLAKFPLPTIPVAVTAHNRVSTQLPILDGVYPARGYQLVACKDNRNPIELMFCNSSHEPQMLQPGASMLLSVEDAKNGIAIRSDEGGNIIRWKRQQTWMVTGADEGIVMGLISPPSVDISEPEPKPELEPLCDPPPAKRGLFTRWFKKS